MRKFLPKFDNEFTVKLKQKFILVISDSDRDRKKKCKKMRIFDLKIINNEDEMIVKHDAKKCPSEQDAKIDDFKFELH